MLKGMRGKGSGIEGECEVLTLKDIKTEKKVFI